MRRPTVFGAISLLSLLRVCAAQNQCFSPDGERANGYAPCDPDADDSPCCARGPGNVCLSNKLCRNPIGDIVRGACTDNTWSSSECAQYCLTPDLNTGPIDLISCANSTGSDTSYCCEGERTFCCDTGVARFDVLPSDPQIVATWDTLSARFIPTSTKTTTTSSSSPTSSPTSSPSSTSTTTTPPPASEEDSEDPPSSSSTSSSLSTGAKAGIGVGSAIGALLILAVAFLLWKLHRTKKAGGNNNGITTPHQQHYELAGAGADGTYIPPGPQTAATAVGSDWDGQQAYGYAGKVGVARYEMDGYPDMRGEMDGMPVVRGEMDGGGGHGHWGYQGQGRGL